SSFSSSLLSLLCVVCGLLRGLSAICQMSTFCSFNTWALIAESPHHRVMHMHIGHTPSDVCVTCWTNGFLSFLGCFHCHFLSFLLLSCLFWLSLCARKYNSC